jgi:hypothetical protein
MYEKSKYKPTARSIGLIRSSSSPFADAVSSFVSAIGVQVVELAVPDEIDANQLEEQIDNVASACGAVVIALESEVVQDGLGTHNSQRSAQPSPALFTLHAFAAGKFPASHIIVVTQHNDPIQWTTKPCVVCELGNDTASTKLLTRALTHANIVFDSKKAAELDIQTFEHPAEWWQRDLAGSADSEIPSFTEFLVDSMFNRSVTQTQLHDEARRQIRSRQPLDLKYHYVGWRAAKAWADLTRDNDYGHQQHIKLIMKRLSAIIQKIDSSYTYHYVSLGPGGGDTDAEILRVLGRKLTIRSLFLVDVSIELLQIAADVIISRVLEPRLLKPSPRVRAMLADFEDSLKNLAPILNLPEVRNIFTLLGFTIGNGDESVILRSVSEGTRAGDYVLFDARLHTHGVISDDFDLSDDARDALVAPYDTASLRAFAFAPVEEASDFFVRVNDDGIDIALTPRWHGHGFSSAVPDAINVYVTSRDLFRNEAFLRHMNMSKASAGGDDLRLATLTFYNLQSLVDWIDHSGTFKVLLAEQVNGSGLILMERLGEGG